MKYLYLRFAQPTIQISSHHLRISSSIFCFLFQASSHTSVYLFRPKYLSFFFIQRTVNSFASFCVWQCLRDDLKCVLCVLLLLSYSIRLDFDKIFISFYYDIKLVHIFLISCCTLLESKLLHCHCLTPYSYGYSLMA